MNKTMKIVKENKKAREKIITEILVNALKEISESKYTFMGYARDTAKKALKRIGV